ncbi:hypothetical protein CDAR_611341 [Caerostris darwini]|uniref:Uncharacterized protein n=1 Tax=Caerostris darwini TaxID=1538125 RepID=A0AAV4UQ35_9ARAC|nr:hypothetical protein CDAR_611341 [Caerostris darwini]
MWPFLSIFRTLAKVLHIKSRCKYCLHPAPPILSPPQNDCSPNRMPSVRKASDIITQCPTAPGESSGCLHSKTFPFKRVHLERFLGIDISPGYFQKISQQQDPCYVNLAG